MPSKTIRANRGLKVGDYVVYGQNRLWFGWIVSFDKYHSSGHWYATLRQVDGHTSNHKPRFLRKVLTDD